MTFIQDKPEDFAASALSKLGRAPINAARSLGHPDAGARLLALCAETVADFLSART
jgi:hypothetical protein